MSPPPLQGRVAIATLGGVLLPLVSSAAVGWSWPIPSGAVGSEAHLDALAAAVVLGVPAALLGIGIGVLASSAPRALFGQGAAIGALCAGAWVLRTLSS